MASHSCPCCGNSLLRHVGSRGTYWFCQTCWQEIPLIATRESQYISYEPTQNIAHRKSIKTPTRFHRLIQELKA